MIMLIRKFKRRLRLYSHFKNIKYMQGGCTSCKYREDKKDDFLFYGAWLGRHTLDGFTIFGPFCFECNVHALRIQGEIAEKERIKNEKEQQENQRLEDEKRAKIIEIAVYNAMIEYGVCSSKSKYERKSFG